MARPSPPMSSSSWFQPWPPETSSSWTISALTRALPCAPRSKPPAPISSTCRPTVPTSIPSSRSSPSSKHSYARPPHAPSMLYGTPSENSSSASLHTNVPTTSPMLAMVYLAGIRSRICDRCRDGAGDDGPNAWDAGQALAHRVALVPGLDAQLEAVDLYLEALDLLGQRQQHRTGFLGHTLVAVVPDDSDQLRDLVQPLRRDHAQLGQVT